MYSVVPPSAVCVLVCIMCAMPHEDSWDDVWRMEFWDYLRLPALLWPPISPLVSHCDSSGKLYIKSMMTNCARLDIEVLFTCGADSLDFREGFIWGWKVWSVFETWRILWKSGLLDATLSAESLVLWSLKLDQIPGFFQNRDFWRARIQKNMKNN